MTPDTDKELTFIVYNGPDTPKYLKVNARLIKALSIFIPILIILSIFVFFFYSMFLKNEVVRLKSEEPKIINELVFCV